MQVALDISAVPEFKLDDTTDPNFTPGDSRLTQPEDSSFLQHKIDLKNPQTMTVRFAQIPNLHY